MPLPTLPLQQQARYQFKMDRRVLSPVQLAAITRIYGEHGAEILELLRKNPCKTVPVILARLRQKDVEWRVVSGLEGVRVGLRDGIAWPHRAETRGAGAEGGEWKGRGWAMGLRWPRSWPSRSIASGVACLVASRCVLSVAHL